jgi:hypothetical protein
VGAQRPTDKRDEHTEEIDTIGSVSVLENDTETNTLEKLQSKLTSSAKTRNTYLRKEQISLGVLHALFKSLGRILLEQVSTQYIGCVGTTLVTTNTFICVWQAPLVVIDPFAGTASTGVMALRTGCYFIGLDNDNVVHVRTNAFVLCARLTCVNVKLLSHVLCVHAGTRQHMAGCTDRL